MAVALAVDSHHPERVHGERRQLGDAGVRLGAEGPVSGAHSRPRAAVTEPGQTGQDTGEQNVASANRNRNRTGSVNNRNEQL